MAVNFAIAAETEDVGVFDLPEIVFGLGIGIAEGHVRVGPAVNVGHAVGIAIDGDVAGQFGGGSGLVGIPGDRRTLDGTPAAAESAAPHGCDGQNGSRQAIKHRARIGGASKM